MINKKNEREYESNTKIYMMKKDHKILSYYFSEGKKN